jgi:hypothetical protein
LGLASTEGLGVISVMRTELANGVAAEPGLQASLGGSGQSSVHGGRSCPRPA